MLLSLIPFTSDHYSTYQNWFHHRAIHSALGSIDNAWLNYILNNSEGIEYAVVTDNELVAVIGVVLPTTDANYYAITNLAVHPQFFRKGIGSQTLQLLLSSHPIKPDQYWVAFVDEWNTRALLFFIKNGWQKLAKEEKMYRLEWRDL